MDFNAAIQAHTQWKMRIIVAAKNGNNEKMDPGAVGKDNVCGIGQWLYGEGKGLMAGRPEYQELLKLHADFHRQAASLISRLNIGEGQQVARVIEDRNSDFSQLSVKVVGLLMKLKAAGM